MLKKAVMLLLCLSLCTVTAFAAYGSVMCDLQNESSTIPRVNGQGGFDRFRCKTTAREQRVSSTYVKNIYAKATVQGEYGEVYTTAQQTNHNTKTAAALTDYAQRMWSASEVKVQGVGLARTRYNDDSVSQDTSATQFVSLGGRTTYSAKTEPSAEAKMTLGENKRNNMISVMQSAFGIDLTEYQFVSFGDLWDNAAETTYPALRAIAIDRYVEVEQGQRLPLGFLYQGTTAYTVVEQPNGSLEMIKYELLRTDQVQAGEDRVAEQDDMQYKVLETENKMAPQSVVETLYF